MKITSNLFWNEKICPFLDNIDWGSDRPIIQKGPLDWGSDRPIFFLGL